ncbi:hypothetical protein S83_033424, partial [Arachis hypogaea]
FKNSPCFLHSKRQKLNAFLSFKEPPQATTALPSGAAEVLSSQCFQRLQCFTISSQLLLEISGNAVHFLESPKRSSFLSCRLHKLVVKWVDTTDAEHTIRVGPLPLSSATTTRESK